ncbi:MAG: bifunctional phosphoribosylaminoimidazolecarboxamide formyltransferase/IMP cyclohydrolase, partial [Thermoplasmata archaeon]
MKFLISVYDKKGLVKFLSEIREKIDCIYATHGTYVFLKKNGFDSHDTSEVTGFEDLLGGRVKTLHPIIYSGLLYRDEKDKTELKFDAVISNLYPFMDSIGNEENMIENIDIGGVSITRAAAKNYRNILTITDPSEYDEVSERLIDGNIDIDFRKRLAMKAFARMAEYDANIYNAFTQHFGYDREFLLVSGKNGLKLRYGENPDQLGYVYNDGSGNGIANAEKLNGKELSYNNILDADSAFETSLEFKENTAVIIKHNTPCGVASDRDIIQAFKKAWNSDSESAYGSVVAINTEVTEELAHEMKSLFMEVLIAPGYNRKALKTLSNKKNLRILRLPWIRNDEMRIRSISNGYLAQSATSAEPKSMKLVT